MHESKGTSANGGGLPWAFVFDPAANARVMGDVQRRGLLAAQQLVERMVPTADDAADFPSGESGGEAEGASPARVDPLADLIRAWGELATKVMAGLVGEGEPGPPGPASPGSATITLDVLDQPGSSHLRLDTDPRGQLRTPCEIWLRNSSAQALGSIRLHAEDLHTPGGDVLEAACIRFDPHEFDELPARSARGVAVTVSTGQLFIPGTYRGIIQSEGATDLCVTLQIVVHG
jgi:hypothetical protein